MIDTVVIKDIVNTNNGWFFEVEVKNKERTNHEVILEKDYWRKLTSEEMDPRELVKKSFKFLLERESANSILKSFNLKIIKKYFPEYEKEMAK